jgi:hypothetical protein
MLNVRKTTSRAPKAKVATAPEVAPEVTNETVAPVETTAPEPVETKEENEPMPKTEASTPASTVNNGEGFKIDKGVALPDAKGGGGKAKYPWEALDVGDSFFSPGAKIETFYTLTSAASKKFARKFLARKWDEAGVAGVRVWRTK